MIRANPECIKATSRLIWIVWGNQEHTYLLPIPLKGKPNIMQLWEVESHIATWIFSI